MCAREWHIEGSRRRTTFWSDGSPRSVGFLKDALLGEYHEALEGSQLKAICDDVERRESCSRVST